MNSKTSASVASFVTSTIEKRHPLERLDAIPYDCAVAIVALKYPIFSPISDCETLDILIFNLSIPCTPLSPALLPDLFMLCVVIYDASMLKYLDVACVFLKRSGCTVL